MQIYQCPECQGIFCGWAVKWKYEFICPNCGGRLHKVNSTNKKYRKAKRDHKRISISLAKQ